MTTTRRLEGLKKQNIDATMFTRYPPCSICDSEIEVGDVACAEFENGDRVEIKVRTIDGDELFGTIYSIYCDGPTLELRNGMRRGEYVGLARDEIDVVMRWYDSLA